MNRFIVAIAALLFSFPAFAEHLLTFDNAYVRETPAKITAGYVTIKNNGTVDDVLQSASAPWASKIELHDVKADDKGVLQMTPITSLDVKAGSDVALAPGGRHLMIYGVAQKLTDGETRNITFHFQKAGDVEAVFAVKPITYSGKAAPEAKAETPVVAPVVSPAATEPMADTMGGMDHSMDHMNHDAEPVVAPAADADAVDPHAHH